MRRILCFALLLLGCGEVSARDEAAVNTSSSGPRHGGVLNVISPPEAVTVLGVATTSGFTSRVGSKVVEGLLTYDFDMRPLPVLAGPGRSARMA